MGASQSIIDYDYPQVIHFLNKANLQDNKWNYNQTAKMTSYWLGKNKTKSMNIHMDDWVKSKKHMELDHDHDHEMQDKPCHMVYLVDGRNTYIYDMDQNKWCDPIPETLEDFYEEWDILVGLAEDVAKSENKD